MRGILIGGLAGLWLLAGQPGAEASTTFSLRFDNTRDALADGEISAALVGTGTFTSPVDLTPGFYNLSSLPGFTLSISFPGVTFTEADIALPLDSVAVGISAFNGGLRLIFIEGSGPGANGGPFFGALDAFNASGGLSTQPTDPSFPENYLYFTLVFSGTLYAGNYLGADADAVIRPIPVPEPMSLALLGLGLAGLGLVRRRA
ncbi:PEP-CTERM sorting domain-containing protein [Paracraurococcus ruber]|uniref:Ice-binding protein C-terminal domain-containing protein n=1 Tax=Paracraurococcus ruber TaxID=77675 RepID=A0ABS1CUM4_9PROT|nr:PEP-CTERM sorting domain-containing protein [Paracraurococcus ruber]MBK1658182.1 hypothetical protein [Paracraurococcus ruber]TDG31811.1 PEP-CTERM sorting domain-containing protein [Paracraurococcus ruber]